MRSLAAILAIGAVGAVIAIAARPSAAQGSVEPLASLQSCGPVRVNFDDLQAATHVAEQYAARGVHFVDDATTTPLIYANSDERRTSSPPNSLANDADGDRTSADVPLTLTFDEPQSKAGFTIGNGSANGTPTATLTAYDAAGTPIGSVTTTVPANDLTQFFGISAAAGGIRKVTLDYGATPLSEEIDDLCFSTDAPPAPVVALPYKPVMVGLGPRIVFSSDLAIHGIEITQAIQCFNTAAGIGSCPDNSLPVVQGKSTAVRIYLKHSSLFASEVSNIPVRLWYRVGGGAWAAANVSGKAKSALSQINADDSANVFFNVTSSSPSVPVQFYAEVDPANALAESNEANNRYPAAGSITMNFQRRESFRVVGRRVHYHPPGYAGAQDPAGWAITGGAATWWNQVLPLRNNAINYTLASGSKDFTTSLGADGQHALIQSLNFDWLLGNVLGGLFGGGTLTGARHVYGWTPNAGFSGGHADMPVYPHAGGLGIVGIGTDQPGTSTDNPGSGAIIFGHELTHDYDVKHTNTADSCGSSDGTTDFPYSSSSIQEVGFNPVTQKIYDPALTHDLMSYCPPGARLGWISPFTWNKMFPKLAASAVSALALQPLQQEESLVVDATLFRDGGGELGTLHQVPVASAFSPSEDGAYAIELRGSSGETLERVPFMVDFQGEETEGPFAGLMPEVGRSFTIPWLLGTRSVALLFGEDVLDERDVSAAPPSVEILSATPKLLEWEGADKDGDALTYSVFYSRDNGESWQLLESGLPGPALELNTDELAGSPSARFRVVASDGVNTGASEMSEAVNVPNKPPVATIMDPLDGVRVPAGSLVVLLGTALDLEDGMLDDGSLSWSSDGAFLGTGPTIPLTLDEPGKHTVTLAATDADGAGAVATADVYVGSVDEPTVTPSPSTVGQAVVASARAHGAGAGATCTVDYGDGSGELAGTMSGSVCTGLPHAYVAADVYPVVVHVSDSAGEVGEAGTHQKVNDARPTATFVTGGGWVRAGGSKVEFGIVARWRSREPRPSGETTVHLPAGLLKSSDNVWLAVDGRTARYLGHATLNRVGGYDFLVEATDGRKDDAFRIRVWKRVTGEPVFDGGGPLGGGSIVLHK